MKKWRWILAIVIVIFLMLYAFTWFFVIPETAKNSLPYKWRNVVAGLKQTNYKTYLGSTDKSEFGKTSSDIWVSKNGNYTFLLIIDYNIDSVAEKVSVSYTFSNYLFNKEGIISKSEE